MFHNTSQTRKKERKETNYVFKRKDIDQLLQNEMNETKYQKPVQLLTIWCGYGRLTSDINPVPGDIVPANAAAAAEFGEGRPNPCG